MEKTRIDYTLDSREVAEMIEKQHKNLMRDIKRYLSDFSELNIEPANFFRDDIYKDEQGKDRPCYKITKNGCEFIAHKLTGIKGTAFTARYINRFHEMEETLNRERQLELPWFIHNFNGRYIILERDFIQITGIDIKNISYFTDWNILYQVAIGMVMGGRKIMRNLSRNMDLITELIRVCNIFIFVEL